MNHLQQIPPAGEYAIHFRGDSITFTLKNTSQKKGKAWLRSNIGHANIRNAEIIKHAEEGAPPLSRDWHDTAMEQVDAETYSITLPLLQVGRFEAKAYFIETASNEIQWPEGPNSVLKVEPAETCASNTMYTAFVRQFGESKTKDAVSQEDLPAVEHLDQAGYAVIPKSGKFRDLINELDFIVGTLRCKIIQLLPIHPTPTTHARMGRFGSPFAVMNLFDVDPALSEFDKLTTPLEQFQELVDEIHLRKARVFLDMPINHTGWASRLQIEHPEWFHRNEDQTFMSPGAWGTLWEDLSKLDYAHQELWAYMADVFLFWCRKGVDGFRCDAGYKIPFKAWEYIIAKVRMEYPNAIFMLEGLGGHKEVTEKLLTDSGMNWAYSEIFQQYHQNEVEQHLPESLHIARSKGNLIHFSETHDNARLAATSQTFARLRTAFCALSSQCGAFGFANGVEWYAEQQINVHNSHPLQWGSEPNMVDFIRQIHAIMEVHPAFHSGAHVQLITTNQNNSVALSRQDSNGENPLLLLFNLDHQNENTIEWNGDFHNFTHDLLNGETIQEAQNQYLLQPGETRCLSNSNKWLTKISKALSHPFKESQRSADQVLLAKTKELFLHFDALESADPEKFITDPKAICEQLADGAPIVTTWQWSTDKNRTALLPPDHFLLIKSEDAFFAELKNQKGETIAHQESVLQKSGSSFALFHPLNTPEQHETLSLKLTVFNAEEIKHSTSSILQLCPETKATVATNFTAGEHNNTDRYAICTNNHGALSQARIGWAELRSKYDGLLSANLNTSVPTDRHTMFSRCRAWVTNKGYSNELSLLCQKSFGVNDDGAIVWTFDVPVGEGLLIHLKATLELHPDTNAIRLTFSREKGQKTDSFLSDKTPITLILRPDIEDRENHQVTKAFAGPEAQWDGAITSCETGFTFAPDAQRKLHINSEKATFHADSEWNYMIHHAVDLARGIDGSSDLYSPGYFKLSLKGGESSEVIASINETPTFQKRSNKAQQATISLQEAMEQSMDAFVVKRDQFQTVIAGYPWFLDWGRDTLICLRGIIAAGKLDVSENILLQFAKFEKKGTIPNMIRGNDDNNRETSDAPLWLFVACDELMKAQGNQDLLNRDCGEGRTLKEVLISLANGLISGTENGITVDRESGLIFSPSHFTWMDTNYPAGTPREGYPIEIQSLWHYALNMLSEIDAAPEWKQLKNQVHASIQSLYVIEENDYTYLADNLTASPGTSALQARQDDALRSNQLFAITLGAITDPALCKKVIEACEQLLIPGAIRSLADRPVKHLAPVYNNGQLLNDPQHPYWGQYTGDEDTRRKPAYHNGTAWTWPFPSYPEALVMVYGEKAIPTALAILGSASETINNGCLLHSPEVIDGNTPHTQRGCGAQAWGATELYRMLKHLNSTSI